MACDAWSLVMHGGWCLSILQGGSAPTKVPCAALRRSPVLLWRCPWGRGGRGRWRCSCPSTTSGRTSSRPSTSAAHTRSSPFPLLLLTSSARRTEASARPSGAETGAGRTRAGLGQAEQADQKHETGSRSSGARLVARCMHTRTSSLRQQLAPACASSLRLLAPACACLRLLKSSRAQEQATAAAQYTRTL